MSLSVLPDHLLARVLSFLPVKNLLQLRCVSKSWNTLLFDPTFIKMHLQNFTPHPTLFLSNSVQVPDCTLIPFHIRRLPYSLSSLHADDCRGIVGSCNGVLCLLGSSFSFDSVEIWFTLWNPATRKRSGKLGFLRDPLTGILSSSIKFGFGYDNSTDTYKIVALHTDGFHHNDQALMRTNVKVFNLGDNNNNNNNNNNAWRTIHSLTGIVPLRFGRPIDCVGVYLNGTLNWLAIRDKPRFISDSNTITVPFVIISVDLGTEMYTQLMPPPHCFDTAQLVEPTICKMMDCLCFSDNFKGTHLVIWKMVEFGVEESWTQLFKIGYPTPSLQNGNNRLTFDLLWEPLGLSENGDTVILSSDLENQVILYNWKDNTVERIKYTYGQWQSRIKDYVESLVSIC